MGDETRRRHAKNRNPDILHINGKLVQAGTGSESFYDDRKFANLGMAAVELVVKNGVYATKGGNEERRSL